MPDIALFFLGASTAVVALIEYQKRYYRLVPKEEVTLSYIEHKFHDKHPAKLQVCRQILYNRTPESFRELQSDDE